MSGKPTKLRFKVSKKRTKDSDNASQSYLKRDTRQKDVVAAPGPSDSQMKAREDWMMMSINEQRGVPRKNGSEKFVKESFAQPPDIVEPETVEPISYLQPSLRESYDVSYEFGDSGSSWRMMKLKKLYKAAQETGKAPDFIALERYGNLLDFDIAREEEKELKDRMDPAHIKKTKPNGLFYHQRQFDDVSVEAEENSPVDREVKVVDKSTLNELKARLLKAKLAKDPRYAELEDEYQKLEAKLEAQEVRTDESNVIYPQNDSMTISEMYRAEKLTDHNKAMIKDSVKSILKDKKFSMDLDEQDEKLSSLGKNIRSGRLKTTSNMSQLLSQNKALERCHLCLDNNKPIPIIYQTDKFALAVAPYPSIVKNASYFFPLQHHSNSLEFESDETHELKKIMISLSKFYYETMDQKVIFYESNNSPTKHCFIMAVPLPRSIDDRLIFDSFKNAIIEESNDLDAQHRIVIDTRENSYDKYISKQAPFFHLWISMNGGIGHIIEEDNWPRSDLFARRVIGGLLKLDKFDVEARTKTYVNGGITDELLRPLKKSFEKYAW